MPDQRSLSRKQKTTLIDLSSSFPVMIVNYIIALFIYDWYEVPGSPPFFLYIVVPLILVVVFIPIILFININNVSSMNISGFLFLAGFGVNCVFICANIHESVNGFVILPFLVQGLVYLNSYVGFFSTLVVGFLSITIPTSITLLKYKELLKDDLMFLVYGIPLTFGCAFINRRTLIYLKKMNKLFKRSKKSNEETEEKKEQIEGLASKLSKYLSPQVYDSIFSGKKDVKLETNRKKLTIFFSDISGFTELTDQMEGESLALLLNSYLSEMSKIALKYKGTIDKFIGDAILIFYGDPESRGEKEDAIACVSMALEMRERMHELRKQWDEQGISRPLRIRIGINTGFCTVGNFGTENRLDYTVIGGQVNLASRLESNTVADEILISHETYALVRSKIYCEKKDDIKVKGIIRPVRNYQVVGLYEKLGGRERELIDKYDGLTVSINFDKMEEDEVLTKLEILMSRIERRMNQTKKRPKSSAN